MRNSNGIFGARAGYNQQFGSFVLGLEGDISSFRSNKSSTRTGNPFFPFAGNAVSPAFATFNTTVSTDWLATARLRAGFAVDRALFYATGGAAFGNVKFKNREREFSNNGLGFGNESSAVSKTKTGWALGVGAEYAITSNVLLSAEYLHVDLGSVTASGRVTSNNTRTATLNFRTKVKSEIGRVGLSYKF